MTARGPGRMNSAWFSDGPAPADGPDKERHDVQELAVCCGDVTIAVELHRSRAAHTTGTANFAKDRG
jgi:hypothetical protein